jgi:3-phenylpropionate/cinnamic acid dioxygenase small subunit
MPADIDTLAARLQRLEDIEEIRGVFLRYAEVLDADDFAGYGDLFASDGVLSAQLGAAVGPDAIRELLQSKLGTDIAKARATSFHVISNPVIHVDGDTATARVLWSYLTQRAEDPHPILIQAGHYDDDLRRENGRWKIARHTITRDMGFSPIEAATRAAAAS